MSGNHQEDVDGEDPGGHVDHHRGEVESEDGQQDVHLDECENEVEGEVEDVYEDGNGDKGGKVECEDCKQDVHQAKDQPYATPDYPRLHQTPSFLKKGTQINFDQSQIQDQDLGPRLRLRI